MKRIFLALTFVAALGAAGLGMSSTAEARHGCYDYGFGYSTYYPAHYSYYDYGPRFTYYRSHGYPHRHHRHHHRGHHHHRDRGGLSFSIGF